MMNLIQMFILIFVNIFALLKFVDANPVGSDSSSDCDTTHPYCCNPSLDSPLISDLYDELNCVIDVLDAACTNSTFRENVK